MWSHGVQWSSHNASRDVDHEQDWNEKCKECPEGDSPANFVDLHRVTWKVGDVKPEVVTEENVAPAEEISKVKAETTEIKKKPEIQAEPKTESSEEKK